MEFDSKDLEGIAWLCEMAARGCIHENKSAMASHLFQDTARIREYAEAERQREAIRRFTSKAPARAWAR